MLRVAARFVAGAAVGAVAAWTVFGDRVNDLGSGSGSGSGTVTATTAGAEPRTSVAPESRSQATAGFPGDEALAALAEIEWPADRRSARSRRSMPSAETSKASAASPRLFPRPIGGT